MTSVQTCLPFKYLPALGLQWLLLCNFAMNLWMIPSICLSFCCTDATMHNCFFLVGSPEVWERNLKPVRNKELTDQCWVFNHLWFDGCTQFPHGLTFQIRSKYTITAVSNSGDNFRIAEVDEWTDSTPLTSTFFRRFTQGTRCLEDFQARHDSNPFLNWWLLELEKKPKR